MAAIGFSFASSATTMPVKPYPGEIPSSSR